MKKILLLTLLLISMFVPTQHSEALKEIRGDYDPILLERMHNNPNNYIVCEMLGMGRLHYLEKSTISIEWSNDKETVLNVKRVFYVYYPNENGKVVEKVAYWDYGTGRFTYNHVSHNIFEEAIDDYGNISWKYVEPSFKTSSGKIVSNSSMGVAEVAYYYAMGKPFFNPPHGYGLGRILSGNGETYYKLMTYVKSIQ